jgi:hypothetical protein
MARSEAADADDLESLARARETPFVVFVQLWAMQQGYGAIPQMHREFCEWIEATEEENKRLGMAYRHSAKSTIMGCLRVCWKLSRDPNLSFLIVSAGTDLARRNSKFIRDVIETHPLCTHLLPDKGEQWQVDQFSVRRTVKRLDASVSVTSIMSRMTGFHGDEIICDDIEIAENAKTPEGRETIRRGIASLNSMGSRFLYIGTPHDEDTIYDDLEYHRGYVTKKWSVWKRMPTKDTPGIPQAPDFIQNGEAHDEKWIADKELGTTGTFKSQFLLIPAKAYEAQLDPELLVEFEDEVVCDEYDLDERTGKPTFYIGNQVIKDIRAYYDPASGLASRDNAVIAVAAKTAGNDVYLLAATTLPPVDKALDRPFTPQMKKLLDVLADHHCTTVNVEANGIGFTLDAELRSYARERRRKLRIRPSTRTSRQNKKMFIAETIEPLMKVGRLYVHRSLMNPRHPFMTELSGFPNTRKDDHVDAVAGAINELMPSRALGDTADLADGSKTPFRRANGQATVINHFS